MPLPSRGFGPIGPGAPPALPLEIGLAVPFGRFSLVVVSGRLVVGTEGVFSPGPEYSL